MPSWLSDEAVERLRKAFWGAAEIDVDAEEIRAIAAAVWEESPGPRAVELLREARHAGGTCNYERDRCEAWERRRDALLRELGEEAE